MVASLWRASLEKKHWCAEIIATEITAAKIITIDALRIPKPTEQY